MKLVHIVDDDEAVRDALDFLLRGRGFATRVHESAAAFLALGEAARDGVLIIDIRMPGMSGIELFHELKKARPTPPVIFLTGHGDVPLAVEAIKAGAFDFREKPFDENGFVDSIERAFMARDSVAGEQARRADLDVRMSRLSPREREVMTLMLKDLPNKVIAHELGIALRTVEVHRAKVLSKMGARSLVSLAAMMKG